jgi:hypothetical protein
MSARISPHEAQKIELGKFSASPMIQGLGTMAGCQIYSNWTEESTKKFQNAVALVVEMNPILSGFMLSEKPNSAYIVPHQFKDFVEITKYIGEKFDLNSMSSQEKVIHLEKNILPLIQCLGTGEFQLKNKSRVFHCRVIEFENDLVAISIQMSHSIGDGATLFGVIDLIKFAMMDQDVVALNWTSDLGKAFNGLGDNKGPPPSKLAKVCFILGMINLAIFGPKRSTRNVLVSKAKIGDMKKNLKNEKVEYLSSNDVLTAAIFEASKSTHLMMLAVDNRNHGETYEKDLAGNFESTLFLPKENCKDPNEIRLGLKELFWGKPKKPMKYIIRGKFGAISNVTSLETNLECLGAKLECGLATGSLLKTVLQNTVFISSFDSESICLHHNIPENHFDYSKVLGKLLL